MKIVKNTSLKVIKLFLFFSFLFYLEACTSQTKRGISEHLKNKLKPIFNSKKIAEDYFKTIEHVDDERFIYVFKMMNLSNKNTPIKQAMIYDCLIKDKNMELIKNGNVKRNESEKCFLDFIYKNRSKFNHLPPLNNFKNLNIQIDQTTISQLQMQNMNNSNNSPNQLKGGISVNNLKNADIIESGSSKECEPEMQPICLSKKIMDYKSQSYVIVSKYIKENNSLFIPDDLKNLIFSYYFFLDTTKFIPKKTLEKYTHTVNMVAWSPDGKYLSSPNHDKIIELWDAKTWEALPPILTEHEESLAWSPDGRYLASASWDRTIKIWDIKAWNPLTTLNPLSVTLGHIDVVAEVAWSPDGKHLASACYDQTINIWNVTTKKALKILKNDIDGINNIKWSPDGCYLASFDETIIKVWDTKTWESRLLEYCTDMIAWSPDGQYLAGAAFGGQQPLKIWNTKTWKPLTIPTEYVGGEYDIKWSPDGCYLASFDQNIRIWDTKTWQILTTLKGGNTYCLYSMEWSPDGQHIASAGSDKTIKIWDTKTWKLLTTLKGHTDGVSEVAWSPDGQHLASASEDATIKIWGMPDRPVNKLKLCNDHSIEKDDCIIQ